MTKNEEHAFKIFHNLIKEKNFPSIILLCGKEQFLIDWAYDELIRVNIDKAAKTMDLTVFDCKGSDFSEVLAAVETFPIASPKKLVVLSEFTALHKESPYKLPAKDEKIFFEILEDIPKETILIIKAGNVDKSTKLYKNIEKNGKIFEFDSLKENDLRAFIVKHFASYGKKIELAAKEHIVKNSGYFNKESDYYLIDLENDIRKISAYSEGDTVITSDVLAILSENIESHVFAMSNNITNRNFGNAIISINKLLNSKNKEKNIEFKIISALASQYELMLKILELKEEGFNLDMMIKVLKLNSTRVEIMYKFARQYEREDVAKLLKFIYSMDKSIKEGLMDAVLLFEMFVSMNASLLERKG